MGGQDVEGLSCYSLFIGCFLLLLLVVVSVSVFVTVNAIHNLLQPLENIKFTWYQQYISGSKVNIITNTHCKYEAVHEQPLPEATLFHTRQHCI